MGGNVTFKLDIQISKGFYRRGESGTNSCWISQIRQQSIKYWFLKVRFCVYFTQHIWTDIGETEAEKDRMLLELEMECMQVYRRKVEQASNVRAELHQSLMAKEAELAALIASLGEHSAHLQVNPSSALNFIGQNWGLEITWIKYFTHMPDISNHWWWVDDCLIVLKPAQYCLMAWLVWERPIFDQFSMCVICSWLLLGDGFLEKIFI